MEIKNIDWKRVAFKALDVVECAAYVLGTIGGFGYCLYSKAYVIAVAVVGLAAMAFPEARRAFKDLIKSE